MISRWANFAVVALWLATMTWLVKEKVLPPLLVGEPPSVQAVLAAREQEPLVGWRVCWNGEPIGWALSRVQPRPDRSTDILSRVLFERLPLGELTPGWLRAMFNTLANVPAHIRADACNQLLLDPQGRLARVESSVRFEPFDRQVTLSGRVDGNRLILSVRSHDLVDYGTTIPFDPEVLHGDVLSPQTQLPGLRVGQTWTVEACSPLCYPNNPLESLQAEVVGIERMEWQGKSEPVWRVEYRGSAGSRLSNDNQPRGRLWVRLDGTILIQEINVFSVRMKFQRMSEKEAETLAEEHGFSSGP
ncbi:MAG TPA: hypothetical protein VJL29_14310 [Thermoguttaceae bacterium]|nr:hypothetical protein [Thermoguttaceae bacterium]